MKSALVLVVVVAGLFMDGVWAPDPAPAPAAPAVCKNPLSVTKKLTEDKAMDKAACIGETKVTYKKKKDAVIDDPATKNVNEAAEEKGTCTLGKEAPKTGVVKSACKTGVKLYLWWDDNKCQACTNKKPATTGTPDTEVVPADTAAKKDEPTTTAKPPPKVDPPADCKNHQQDDTKTEKACKAKKDVELKWDKKCKLGDKEVAKITKEAECKGTVEFKWDAKTKACWGCGKEKASGAAATTTSVLLIVATVAFAFRG